MLDTDLLYIKMCQRELWQEAAKHALVRRLTVARPPWRERWWRHFKQCLTACGLRAPALPTMRVVPAVVCTSKQRHWRKQPMGEPLTMTLSHFAHKVLQAHAPVLVDFWAPWCGPCHVMALVIDQRAAECAGRVTVGKVHVDEQPALAPQYGIRSMPAFLVFTQGHGVDEAVGITSTHVVSAMLAAQLETA